MREKENFSNRGTNPEKFDGNVEIINERLVDDDEEENNEADFFKEANMKIKEPVSTNSEQVISNNII